MHPLRQGSRKRSASVSEQADPMDDSEDGDPTPRKAGKPSGAPEFHIIVDSPPHTRAKQCIRTNEAGDALDVPEPPLVKLWVGRGDVHFHNYHRTFAAADTPTRTDARNVPERT
jgi:hypothetical protein